MRPQHVLDTYVHLYSMHARHVRRLSPSSALSRLSAPSKESIGTVLRVAEGEHTPSLHASLQLHVASLDDPALHNGGLHVCCEPSNPRRSSTLNAYTR
eukprot:573146-Prymnesium_polylepis.1